MGKSFSEWWDKYKWKIIPAMEWSKHKPRCKETWIAAQKAKEEDMLNDIIGLMVDHDLFNAGSQQCKINCFELDLKKKYGRKDEKV